MKTANSNRYRELLQNEFRRRQTSNPSYSLRSFARDLGVTPGFVSGLFTGKRNLSVERSFEISKRLGYDEAQASELVKLIRHEKARESTPDIIDQQSGAQDGALADGYVTLNLDAFQIVADWYHYAILELSRCEDFKPTPEWISARLNIATEDAENAVARLLRLGLLTKTKSGYKKTDAFIATPTDRPHQGLRSFHSQFLEKAKTALKEQDVSRRDISGTTLAFDPEELPFVKKEIQKFRLGLAKKLKQKRPRAVYHLAVQFFEVSSTNNNGVKNHE